MMLWTRMKRWMAGKPPEWERRIERLEHELAQLSERVARRLAEEPIRIDTVNIEHLHIDQVAYENNIAQLGIRSLEGCLNIGANYGAVRSPPAANPPDSDPKSKKPSTPPASSSSMPSGPACTIRPRPEKQ